MSIQKVEMTVERIENGQYVEQIAYPYVEYEHVTMENGMDIMSMIRDDVSTPMVTHNTTSWKVGQGDSDVSETVVDSSVGDMTIKGQTYQNILPNPSLRNSMTNGKTMQKLNEGYDSVNTVDGVYKSAILKGQTLVNLISDGEVTKNATNNWVVFSADFNADMIKTSTDYTLITYVISNTLSDGSGCDFGVSGGVNDGFGFKAIRVPSGKVGVYKIKLTTKNVFSEPPVLRQQIFNDVATGSITFKQVLVEGDYTNVDVPYFEGMQSVKMPVLKATGKNLFDGISFKKWWVNVAEGVQKTETGNNKSILINIKPNTKYRLSGEGINRGAYAFLNANFEELSRGGNTTGTRQTEESPSGSKYLLWYLHNEDISNCSNVQVEEGAVATSYEPFKSNILTVNEDVELGSVGEVKDELNLLTKQLTQRTETRPYQEGDESNSEVLTDMTNTRYKLPKEAIKTVDLTVLDQDNQPVAQLNSFANGYIQVSSQGLTPSVDYEVPTSNSYYVDLMKANTQYTMKNMQGAFTIDGIQYNASANGTFTSPSTLSNRLMITSVLQTQPMLLEGDMTSKEVPYVEGNKSAFEGVDKVEIVSQNADNSLSNTTSFQLTNPLRSLPNGVRDEIVLDRVNHKAKIIQRVGEDLTQLDTPIVTEVNLEGYPYVYKGGHIFLNTEIAPTTEVTYSINQAHQIESSNEDILRHQKEINQLYELIAQYVQVQYEAELIDIALQG